MAWLVFTVVDSYIMFETVKRKLRKLRTKSQYLKSWYGRLEMLGFKNLAKYCMCNQWSEQTSVKTLHDQLAAYSLQPLITNLLS